MRVITKTRVLEKPCWGKNRLEENQKQHVGHLRNVMRKKNLPSETKTNILVRRQTVNCHTLFSSEKLSVLQPTVPGAVLKGSTALRIQLYHCIECRYMNTMKLYAHNAAICRECSHCTNKMQLHAQNAHKLVVYFAQNAAKCAEFRYMQTAAVCRECSYMRKIQWHTQNATICTACS